MTKRSGPQRVATDARADLGFYPLHSMVVPKSEEDSDGRGSGFRVPVAPPIHRRNLGWSCSVPSHLA